MQPRRRSDSNRTALIQFWILVGVICAVAGAVSYQAGRYWVSNLISDVKVDTRRIKLPTANETGSGPGTGSFARRAPSSAQVVVEEREPTDVEKREITVQVLERQAESAEPQDGAQLNRQRFGEPRQASANAPRAPAASQEDGKKWVVVAGSFLQQSNADRLADELVGKGYHPFITEFEKDGLTYRRVNVAAFANRDDADELVNQLKELGISARVVQQ